MPLTWFMNWMPQARSTRYPVFTSSFLKMLQNDFCFTTRSSSWMASSMAVLSAMI